MKCKWNGSLESLYRLWGVVPPKKNLTVAL
jgi:hypothetical protein